MKTVYRLWLVRTDGQRIRTPIICKSLTEGLLNAFSLEAVPACPGFIDVVLEKGDAA